MKEAYMKQPKDFILPNNRNKICKLVKSVAKTSTQKVA